jgi:shikimate kinase
MPGAGKSTMARQLGRKLGLTVVDSDTVIESRIGSTISDFFAREGEEAFRDVEEQVIAELTSGEPKVLATGGGTVLRAANRLRLRAGGTVIYLFMRPEHIYARLRDDVKRPLLQVENPLARLRQLFAQRHPLYGECAHITVNVDNFTPAMLLNLVITRLDLMHT